MVASYIFIISTDMSYVVYLHDQLTWATCITLKIGRSEKCTANWSIYSNNPRFMTLRKIEAAREIASTMAHSSNKVMLRADNLLLNIQEIHEPW